MLESATRVALPLCLMAIMSNAFTFDPRTGECKGDFAHCPPATLAAAAQCEMDKRLQCFSAELNKEVVFACTGDGHSNNTIYTLSEIAALPCTNVSLSTSTSNDTNDNVQLTTFLDAWEEFDLHQFFINAKPALVVAGSIGGVILALVAIVCVAARSGSKCCSANEKSKDRQVQENAYYY